MKTEQISTRPESCGKLVEAEGLLDLVTLPACRLGISRTLQRRIARRALRTAFRSHPPAELAWRRDLAVGQSLRLLNRFELALGPLLAATRRHGEDRATWVALGWCLKRLGRVDRAASVLARAVTRIPDDPVLHFNLACYLALLGQADMAISQLLWALDLEPGLKRRLARERDFDPIRGLASFQALSQ